MPAVRAFAWLVAGALVLACSAATAGAAGRCGVHGKTIPGIARSRVVSARGDVVVYRVRHRSSDTYWACRRGHARRVLMGRDDSYAMRYELYGPTKAFGEIRTAGDWVTAIHEEDNSPECGKYGETECEGRSTTLVGVAWLEDAPAELHGCAATVLNGKLACPELTLSKGPIDPGSIHLSGTAADGVHTATV